MRINKILENDFQDEAKILVSTYFERAMQSKTFF
jgi:hypothetical protein